MGRDYIRKRDKRRRLARIKRVVHQIVANRVKAGRKANLTEVKTMRAMRALDRAWDKKRKPIAKVSASMKKRRAAYLVAKRKYLRTHTVCQMCKLAKATDVHHARGRVAALLMNELYWAHLCRTCHNWLHDHPEWSKKHGWIGPWGKQEP